MFCSWNESEGIFYCRCCGVVRDYPYIRACENKCSTSRPKQPEAEEKRIRARVLPRCRYLGDAMDNDGTKLLIKCTCPASSGVKEQWHQSHVCNAPEHKRSNGEPGRCLPTMRQEFDADHATEAAIYKLCAFCEIPNRSAAASPTA